MKAIKLIILILFTTIVLTSTTFAQENIYSLDTCKSLALQNNANIQNKKMEIENARQTKNIAFTKYFPSISASGGGFKTNNPLIDVDASSVDINLDMGNQYINDVIRTLYNLYSPYFQDANLNIQTLDKGFFGSVTALQPVFAGGRIVTGNKLANLGIQAAEYQLNITEQEVLLKTEQNYWQIISLYEKLKTIESVNKLLDTLYKDVTGAVNAGLTTKNDALKVKLKQNEMKSNLLRVNNGIKLAKMALCQYIGIEYNDRITFADTIDVNKFSPYEIQDTNHRNSLVLRPEYKLLDLSVNAERLQKRMTLGEALPSVAIGGAYIYNNLMQKNNFNALAMFTVSIPISNWWETSYKLKQHNIKLQIAETTRSDIDEMLLLQMQLAWNDIVETYSQVLLSKETIEEAEANLKLTNDYYKAGMMSLSELLQAQTSLQQARDQYSDSEIEYKIKYAHYKQMIGK